MIEIKLSILKSYSMKILKHNLNQNLKHSFKNRCICIHLLLEKFLYRPVCCKKFGKSFQLYFAL